MARLTILRHAKSSWALPGAADIERTLNLRGQEQLLLLALWLSNLDDKPDAVICSSAVRTQQTWLAISGALDSPTFDTRGRLYSGGIDVYLEEIWATEAKHLLLIGHNPTCDDMVRALVGRESEASERLSLDHFGTANLASFHFEGADSTAVTLAKGHLEHYIRPSDLAKAE